MDKEIVLFKSEEKKSAVEVADALRLVADKIEAGKVILEMGADKVELDIPGQVTFEIKAEEEAGAGGKVKRSLELEVEWGMSDNKEPIGEVKIS